MPTDTDLSEYPIYNKYLDLYYVSNRGFTFVFKSEETSVVSGMSAFTHSLINNNSSYLTKAYFEAYNVLPIDRQKKFQLIEFDDRSF